MRAKIDRMIAVRNLATRIRNLVVAEVPLLLGVVIAAANTATDHSAKGYAVAAAIAALHFVVSPAFEQAALKAKVVDPELVEAVANALRARDAVATALAADPFNGSASISPEAAAQPTP